MQEPAPDRPTEFRRWAAASFSVALLALVLAPLARERDSFPLSSYPMFSSVRTKPWISVVVGRDAQGEQRPIPPTLVANAEVMQAAQTIANAVKRKQAEQLCERVATRVASEPAWADVVSIEVQSRQFDPLTYFTSDEGRTPLRVRRRARCEVPR